MELIPLVPYRTLNNLYIKEHRPCIGPTLAYNRRWAIGDSRSAQDTLLVVADLAQKYLVPG